MKNATPILLAALGLLSSNLLFAATPPATDDNEWVEVLTEKLHLETTGMEPLELDAGELTRSLEHRLGQRAPDAQNLRAARALLDAQELTLLALTLSEGVVGLAVLPDGAVQGVALWDAQDFEEDPSGAWAVFTEQLGPTRQNIAVPVGAQPSAAEVDALVAELEDAPGEDAVLMRVLYVQRRKMRENSFRFTALGRSKDRGEFPPSGWFAEWADNYSDLASNAAPLTALLGDDVGTRYVELARQGEELLRTGAEALDAGDRRAFESATRGLYKQTCQACHRLQSDALGGQLYNQLLRGGLTELGVRSDLLRVGVDLWTVPEQAARSQEVADGVAALLTAAARLR